MIAVGSDRIATARKVVCDEFSSLAPRIRLVAGETYSLDRLSHLRPQDLFLPIDAGDVLSADALFEFALEHDRAKSVDFIYADERRPNLATGRIEAFFKPDWSPTLLWSSNYIGRPWCATMALVREVGLKLPDGDTGNLDLVLRCAEKAFEIAHVCRVLAQRGESNLESQESETRALTTAFNRSRKDWSVEPGLLPNTYRCRPKSAADELVSIIIPTCAARGLIKVCIESLRRVSTYKRVEIIVVDNILDDASEWKPWLKENADIVVEIRDKFNWSRFNNTAAREASGAYLLFLNDDIEITQPDWLEALLEQGGQEGVGIVGPQLLYPDHKVQHAGMFLAGPGTGRHAFRFCAEDDPGYFGLALTQRNVLAVTGACMLVKRDTFWKLGGFDEGHSIINNDLDFCLKAHEAKLQCVYTPFAQLIHHEQVSRKNLPDQHDARSFGARWDRLTAAGDPYFHPNLDRDSDNYQIDAEPTEVIFPTRPLFDCAEIKRILAIKVDHIGDFVTSFSAFRRLKASFPDAELVALLAPASQKLVALEPAIDRVLTYEFFHARSQLGQKEMDTGSLADLRELLEPFKFDLAIDLRKQGDTRTLLQCSGARLTAGFEHRDQFPWLDIALTFEGDTQVVRKRNHVSSDLVSLVDAVVAAGTSGPLHLGPHPPGCDKNEALFAKLGDEVGIYRRRLVCVHPAAGNQTKQWPPGHFASLINLLIATEDVDVALIGGPDETEIADAVISDIAAADNSQSHWKAQA